MIGIVTFHRALNYGAVLQAYALQKTLYNLNIENEIIDYRCCGIENRYKLFSVDKNNVIKSAVRSAAAFPIRLKKHRGYGKFINKYFKLSKSYKSAEEIKRDAYKYSAFITGSDQVFRASNERFDDVYFLSFAQDNQKYSYAASFGTKTVMPEYRERLKELLKNFVSLSVREYDGVDIINDLLNKDARVDIDPTLILDRDSWYKICRKININSYVLIYNVNPAVNLVSFALSLAKK